MGRGGGGGGRGGGGGKTGMAAQATFRTWNYGDSIQMSVGREKDIVLSLPRGLSRPAVDAGRSFLQRSVAKLSRARNDDQLAKLITRGDKYLSGLRQASSWNEALPKAPW